MTVFEALEKIERAEAKRYADLQAENDRLKTALTAIRNILDPSQIVRIGPSEIHEIAVKALGVGE